MRFYDTLDEHSILGKFHNIVDTQQKEIDRIERENEEKELIAGFQEASLDKERLEALREWDILDTEGWE